MTKHVRSVGVIIFFLYILITFFVVLIEFNNRATMSDEGERTCPLCAEEMDLTDQQLKPCKCGYEVRIPCNFSRLDYIRDECIFATRRVFMT